MKRSVLVLAFLIFGTVLPAAAGTVSVQLTGVGGANQGGVYVAPYYLSIDKGGQIGVICDDFSHEVSIHEKWTATIYDFSDLSGTRFGIADTQQYEEAAWLYTKFIGDPSDAGDINFALWALFTPSARNSSGYTNGAATWYGDAITWFNDGHTGVNFDDFKIITPTDLDDSGSPQEYLYYCPPSSPTPEPSSLLFLGTGLLGLGRIARKRLGSADAS